MDLKVFKYSQGNQIFYSTVMTFEEIIKNSMVSIYSRNNRLGYQRNLVERHLKKIVFSLKTDNTPISPTSILLGIDENNLNEYSIQEYVSIEENIKTIKCIGFDKNTEHSDKNNIFRIIDGQHRIMAMDKYINELDVTSDSQKIEELKSYKFSVIIMPINSQNKIKEVEVFQSINAKAKPLKTDLVKLALTRYEELERISEIDYANHLAKRIIFSLNDNKLYREEEEDSGELDLSNITNVWKNGIIIDVNNDDEVGIIGYNAFYKSIEQICKIYTHDINDNLMRNHSFEESDKLLNQLSDEITYSLLIPSWEIIMERWNSCFSYKKLSFDYEIYYDDNYYIQKNMGLRSFHNILVKIIKEKGDNKKQYTEILDEFKEIIVSSKLTSGDWKKGGRFKGLSSEAGFKYVEATIKE